VECTGLDDEQLEAYVKENVKGKNSSSMLNRLKQSQYIWELAHVPVNLVILCVLWEDQNEELRASDWNLLSIYDDMARYMWTRFWRTCSSPPGDEGELRKNVFAALGRIALDAMKAADVYVSDRALEKRARDYKTKVSLTSAGFLFLKKSGRQYHFPHLTFQEYFAGRALVKDLFKGNSKEKEEAEQLLASEKYRQRYLQMFLFAAAESVKNRGWKGVAEVLKAVDRDYMEITTTHHLILKAKLVDAAIAVSEIPTRGAWEIPPLKKMEEAMRWLSEVSTAPPSEFGAFGALDAFGAIDALIKICRKRVKLFKTPFCRSPQLGSV